MRSLPEWHHSKFEMVSVRPERGFGDVIFFHGYLMIAGGQINGGKVFSFSQSVQQVIDAWQQIAVLDCLSVQSPIIDAHAPPTVLLRNEEDRGAVRALRWSDVSLCQQILNLRLELFMLLGTQSVRRSVWWDSTRLGFDFELDLPFWRLALG